MKKNTFLFFFLAFVAVWAQNVEVKGQLQDANGLPLSYVNVTFDGLSNQVFKETMSNDAGEFNLSVEKGKYLVVIQTLSGNIIERKENVTQDTNLGVITVTNTIELGATVAVGEKPLYRLELDKRVYDMERDPSVKGANLSDALNNVPSVQVDGEGTISLRGNENIRVLINGKPSAMTGISNVGDALRNIQADQVERVEVITNPSARYDAAGTGGIINIILKRGSNLGFNGSINTSVGIPTLLGANASLNYRTPQWNFFVNPYVRKSKATGNRDFKNYIYSANQADRLELQNGDRTRDRLNYGGNLGFERYIGEKSTLSASVNMRKSQGDNENETQYQNFVGNDLTAKSLRLALEDETDEDIEGVLGFVHKFNKNGHELSLQTSGSWATEDEITDITQNSSFGTIINDTKKNINLEQQRRWLAQVDYVLPYNENARFEAGYKSELDTNINDFRVEELINDVWEVKNGLTDRVKYTQDVHALYTQYGSRYGKFSYLAGLRMENTQIGINSRNANNGLGSDDEKRYTNWFPSATLNYFIDDAEKNQIQLSYSKRIQRPWSRFLNPFPSQEDDRNVFRGNPDLDPVISQSFELGYITQIGKTTLTPSFYYQSSKDNITIYRRLATLEGNEVFLAQPVNAGDEVRYGAELVASTQLARWWRVFGNLNLFGYENTGTYQDELTGNKQDLSGDGFSWFGRVSNTIILPSKIDFQVNGFYFGGVNNAQSEREPIWAIDLALSKDILQGNGTLAFNVRDLFNTRKRKVHNFADNYDSYIDLQWRPRQFTLNFTYRINQKKKRERSGGREDAGEGMEM